MFISTVVITQWALLYGGERLASIQTTFRVEEERSMALYKPREFGKHQKQKIREDFERRESLKANDSYNLAVHAWDF